MNPGPHGPELCELLSGNAVNDRLQFDSSSRRARSVQIGTNLQPDYYIKYYRAQVVQTGSSVIKRCDRPVRFAAGMEPSRSGESHIDAKIGSTRRECIDWLLILTHRHLDRVLTVWFEHYN